jgi:GT2 family glycosyltransferase
MPTISDDSQTIDAIVLIACHNGRKFLDDCLNSLFASDESPYHFRVVIVDNASADGSADYIAQHFPHVDLIRCDTNLGFAGGNNAGWEFILKHYPRVRHLALLNQDTIVQSGWLAALIKFLDTRPVVGCAQAKVMLHPQTDRFNTAGNVSHFLGFGFTTACGDLDVGQFQHQRRLGLASGAAMLIRADAIARAGLFDPTFFAYLEDADLSWKLRQLGYDAAYVPASVVFHKYHFKQDWRHYYLLERNRWLILATYYKLPTLILLAPALAAMELGQLYFAFQSGVLRAKLRAYGFFFSPLNLRDLWRRRRAAQKRRRINDRRFTESFVGTIDFAELNSALLRRVANPILSRYWSVARKLIVW